MTMAAPCLGGEEYIARAVCTGINTQGSLSRVWQPWAGKLCAAAAAAAAAAADAAAVALVQGRQQQEGWLGTHPLELALHALSGGGIGDNDCRAIWAMRTNGEKAWQNRLP